MLELLLNQMLTGLQRGLSRFSGPSRVALLFARGRDEPLEVFDPQGLLRGHERELSRLFLESDAWREQARAADAKGLDYHELEPPGLEGTIAYAAASATVFFQAWLTDHHPGMCSRGPVERWLQQATELASHELLTLDVAGQTSRAAHDSLRGYAEDAIARHIQLELKGVYDFDFRDALDAILEISSTAEEGALPRGTIVFLSGEQVREARFWARFAPEDAPNLHAYRHVRKLLTTVERGTRHLVSDGRNVLGISGEGIPEGCVLASFRGGRGELRIGDESLCTFAEGAYSSRHFEPSPDILAGVLRRVSLPIDKAKTLRVVTRMVRRVVADSSGCTIVVDSRSPPPLLHGQGLAAPIDLAEGTNWEDACGMAKVDGALHLDGDARLVAFGCLLDGTAIPAERRARGARFNSALRYSSQNPDVLVVVVSKDGPISTFHFGEDVARAGRVPAGGPVETAGVPLEAYLSGVSEPPR